MTLDMRWCQTTIMTNYSIVTHTHCNYFSRFIYDMLKCRAATAHAVCKLIQQCAWHSKCLACYQLNFQFPRDCVLPKATVKDCLSQLYCTFLMQHCAILNDHFKELLEEDVLLRLTTWSFKSTYVSFWSWSGEPQVWRICFLSHWGCWPNGDQIAFYASCSELLSTVLNQGAMGPGPQNLCVRKCTFISGGHYARSGERPHQLQHVKMSSAQQPIKGENDQCLCVLVRIQQKWPVGLAFVFMCWII